MHLASHSLKSHQEGLDVTQGCHLGEEALGITAGVTEWDKGCLGKPSELQQLAGAHCHTLCQLLGEGMLEVFEYPVGGRDISVQLLELRQCSDSAADYAVKSQTLAPQSGWNDPALLAVFRERLSAALQAELACKDINTTLSNYITTDICMDNLFWQRWPKPRYSHDSLPLKQFRARTTGSPYALKDPPSLSPSGLQSSHQPDRSTVKELQWFLGIANLYFRFIRNNSSVASPLTSLLRGKLLKWSKKAQEAFVQIKESLTSALILKHIDPSRSFFVEVDTSSCWIGTVLSQHQRTPGKVHSCAFFSRKLSPAERNYDVGN
ncbi:hypothetical protein QTP70_024766 [Hemibagrus guttatus]|uniref:Reverse transcriptase/retrotransposon-derived protein RNase H-like domain-containing protein n=1 Tax=Hemibagrus guttatus TaxID=175788 RepID=A0AAE0QF09_9TELE|nr:hypothetical protein QTP70_024766 [Hemibagrus guttatus]